MIKINDLTKGEVYSFFVVSRNENGTSLPSSVLTLNVSEAAWNGVNIKGSQLTDTNRKLLRYSNWNAKLMSLQFQNINTPRKFDFNIWQYQEIALSVLSSKISWLQAPRPPLICWRWRATPPPGSSWCGTPRPSPTRRTGSNTGQQRQEVDELWVGRTKISETEF